MNKEALEKKVDEVIKGLAAGRPMGDVCGIGPDEIEAVYSLGYTYYQVGRLEEAEPMFRFAAMMMPLDPKYGYALASTLQAERKYEAASVAYAALVAVDITNPAVYNGVAECRFAMGDKDGAREALEALLMAVKTDTPAGREAVEKARRKIEGLKG